MGMGLNVAFRTVQLLALSAVAISQANGSVPLSGNHRTATLPFWQDYTYCQGRTIVPGKTWQPMANAKLVKLQVMHRHGARSPAYGKLPGDNTTWYQCGNPDEFVFMHQGDAVPPGSVLPIKEQTAIDGAFDYLVWKGNCDAGQLTSLGSHRMYDLGSELRKVYVDELGFLPKHLDSNMKISHAYIWRTRESVENLMAGMYPTPYHRLNQTLDMHVKPSAIEVMISNPTACPKLAALTAAYQNSSAYAATLAPYKALQAKLSAAYNLTGTTVSYIPDTASATYCHGLGLKGNLTGADIQSAMIYGTSSYHNIYRANPDGELVKSLSVGPWLLDIIASFSDLGTKLQVYSAHDASLDMFLAVVADPDLPWPPFSSSVEIELWQHESKGMLVRMYYEGMVVPAHPKLKCSFEGCPLQTLTAFLQNYIPKDIAAACVV